MKKYDALGERMKGYENVTRTNLMRRCPVIIRIDGKAFHTFTRGFKKPFDSILVQSMQETLKYLCENIQGCVLGYHEIQSGFRGSCRQLYCGQDGFQNESTHRRER